MTVRGRTVNFNKIATFVMVCLAVGGVVFGAGKLATSDDVEKSRARTEQWVKDQGFARKEAIQPQLDAIMAAQREQGQDIKTLLRVRGAGAHE